MAHSNKNRPIKPIHNADPHKTNQQNPALIDKTTQQSIRDEATQNNPDTQTANSAPKSKQSNSGPDVIKAYLKNLTASPGVYRMLDKDGNVLYVGKANNLKNRVSSYTRLKGQSNRIARMIRATTEMEFVLTATESEALLLEATYIKKMKPRYNVLLRDDKSFPSILIRTDHDAPQIIKHRGARKQKGHYFGPFASAGSVNRTLNTLQQLFLLRDCTDSQYESRTRPCLQYQIKRCSAPCTGKISIPDYNELVANATDFLRGKSTEIQKDMREKMQAASDSLAFEEAAHYRDRISALTQVQRHQSILPTDFEEGDVFAVHTQGGSACIQVFFIRTGQNWGNRAYYPRIDRSHTPNEILESFIAQFYDNKPVPKLILTSISVENEDLLAQALSFRAERTIKINCPQRGPKADLMAHALNNAKEALARKMAEGSAQTRHLEDLKTLFSLPRRPERIEIYDNSHTQGASPIGAMVVSGREGFAKNQYRKFNFKPEEITAGDDFEMMRIMLTRRLKALIKEHGTSNPALLQSSDQDEDAEKINEQPNSNDQETVNQETVDQETENQGNINPWPDLLLIDGGKGQLSAVMGIIEQFELKDITVVAISKGPDRNSGREQFHIKGQPSFSMDLKDPALYFLQRLRDEAHRFAIGTHRSKRKKQMSANPLDDIAGIGPSRKRALLAHFGSAKAVSRAGLKDLKAVEGISAQMAELIYDFFHELLD